MEKLFKDLGLSENVLSSIEKLGYTNPSKIQELLIPIVLEGKDALGQAQTGTGKTLAFAAGVLSKIKKEGNDVKVMVLSPTRELAIQIGKEFEALDRGRDFKIATLYGGSDISRQISRLSENPDIVIGTPGRVMDLMKRKKLNLENIEFFVLDEADEMLNMGFIDDIEAILEKANDEKQVLMLSATMPKQVKMLVEKYMKKDYEHVVAKSNKKTAENIEQNYYIVTSKTKLEALCRIIDSKRVDKAIIFTKTRMGADELASDLQARGIGAEAMHSEISQHVRLKTLEKFKNGTFKFLVATDVAARGIHIDNINLVINYQLPQDKESYVHRIGRTGRANNVGEAINLITLKERSFLKQIEKFTNTTILEKKVPQKSDILEMKYNEVLEKANKMVENDDLKESLKYVLDLNKGELLNLTAALLKLNMGKRIKSDVDANLEVKEKRSRELESGLSRAFVNIGKKDNLKRNSLLDLIEENTKMPKNKFFNIEVLDTFSFVDMKDEHLEEFIEKFNGGEINGRTINAEISNNKPKSNSRGNSRRDSRGDSRGGSRSGGRERSYSRRDDGKRDDNRRGTFSKNGSPRKGRERGRGKSTKNSD